jgi:hypothetical protein
MASKNVETGELEVVGNKITITTFTGGNPQNIHHLVQSFDIYESLDNNCITADFIVYDGVELTNYLPAAGEEKISLSIKTPSRKTCTYNFFVHTISGMSATADGQHKTYRFQCVSLDYLNNSYMKITKRYTDKKYDEAANEVLKVDFPVSKGLEVEPTKGKFDYVVNNVRPFQIMDLLCERAVPSNDSHAGSNYVFYEDNEKYYFVTLEHLIETRKGKAEGFTFVYDTGNRGEDFDKVVNVRNILNYEVYDLGKSVDKVLTGSQRNQVREFDIYHGDYFVKEEYTNTSDFKKFQKTDKNIDLNSAAYSGSVEGMPARTMMAVKDGLRPEMEHNKSIPKKRAFESKISQHGMKIRVYNDTNLLPGDLVKCKVPEISFTTQGRKEQEVYSGNYFIKNLRLTATKRSDGLVEAFHILDLRRPNLGKEIG